MNSWLIHTLGRLEATVLENRQATRDAAEALHRRMDDHRREMLFHIRRLDKRPKNGNGKPLWLHVASLAMVFGLALLSIFKPETAGALIREIGVALVRGLMH